MVSYPDNKTCPQDCTSNTTDYLYKGDSMHEVAKGVFIALGILELISGIQGNCLMLKSLISREPPKGSYAIYKILLLNLVCADVGVIGYFLPLLVLGLISNCYPVVGHKHCRISGFIFVSCSLASLLFQTVISLNRFLRVCHLKLHRVLFSRRRTVLLCVLCWVLALLLALVPLVSHFGCYSFDCKGHVCSLLIHSDQHFTQTVLVASGIVPVLVIGYCNWAIYQHWKGTRFKSRSQYTIIQMEIKRLKEKLKSRRRNRKKSKEEGLENIGDDKSCPPPVNDSSNEKSTGAEGKFSAQSPSLPGDEVEKVEKHEHSLVSGRPAREDSFLRDISFIDQFDNDDTMCEETHGFDDDDDDEDDDANVDDTRIESELVSEEQSCDASCQYPSLTPMASPCLSGGRKSNIGILPPRQHTKTPKGKSMGRARAKRYLRQLHRVGKCKKKKEKAFVRSLVVVFLIRAVTLSPLSICTLVGVASTLQTEVLVIAYLLFLGNFSVNWIVFGVMNPYLRSDYVKCFDCVFSRCRSVLTRKGSVA